MYRKVNVNVWLHLVSRVHATSKKGCVVEHVQVVEMKIKSIQVKNFRCLKDVFLPCENMTILVGRNGVGKSCLLSALNLFYRTDIRIDERDYYNGNTSEDISITVRFCDLTEQERRLFRPYLEGDELSIEKVITYDPSRPVQKYYGARYQNPEFEAFRKASGQVLRREYNKLRENEEYRSFPSYQNKETAEKVLEEWELSNKEKCEQFRDDGQFFGFQNVGKHRMEKYTKFIHIPAVHRAIEEGVEGARSRGSIFEEIMEIVVKSTLAKDEDLIQLQKDAQKRYDELIDPAKNEDLVNLEKKLTETLNHYVSDSEVNIQWIEEPGIQINPPRAYVTLNEGGYQNTVDRCGHGLQRAYILSLFQQLAVIQASATLEDEGATHSSQLSLPSLIIGIEEPELYQHPDRLRHFAKTLLLLSSRGIEGAIENIQVIHSTHSPLMIDFQRFNQLRIFRKTVGEGSEPKITKIAWSDLSEVSRFVEDAKGLAQNTISNESLRQRLISLMTPWMNEGFFAKLVVLVEGIKDRALIMGETLTRDLDFESMGICVIPCSGKDSMTEAIAIYRCLEIPTFVLWDSDEGKTEGITANRNILRCHGHAPEDYPCKTTDDFCCIRTNLEQTFQEEIGSDNYSRTVSRYCEERDLGKPMYAMENPSIVSEVIALLKSEGYQSNTLREIVDRAIKKYGVNTTH